MTASRIRRDMRADYGDRRGYVCVASKARIDGGDQGPWNQAFFAYPEQLDSAVDWVATEAEAGKCVYRPSSLLAQRQRVPPTVESNVVSFEVDSLPPHGKEFLAGVGAEFRESGRRKHYHIRLFLDEDLPHEDLLHLTRWIMAQCGITGSADSGGKWNPHDMLRPLGTINTKRDVRRPVRIVRHGAPVSLEALRSLLHASHQPDRITLASLPKDARQVDWDTVPGRIRTAYVDANAMGRNNSDGEWQVMNLCAEFGLSPELALGIAIEGRNDGHFPARHDDDSMRRQIAKAYGNHTKAGTLGKRGQMRTEKAPVTANDEGPEGDSIVNDTPGDLLKESTKHYGQAKFAYRLAHHYRSRLMYVYPHGWYVWSKRHGFWVRDREGARVEQAILKVLQAAHVSAFGNDEAIREVKACNSAPGVRGIRSLAESLACLRAELGDLNADPYLITTPGETVNLATDERYSPRAEDRITRRTNGSLVDQRGSEWEKFLRRILPSPGVIEYLQELMGLALLGEQREQILPILDGPVGGNGKSTFLNAIIHVFGGINRDISYAVQGDSDVLTFDQEASHSATLAYLADSRLTLVTETKRGRKLHEARMKQLTGGDPVTASEKHKAPFTFVPKHLMMLSTNHLPQIEGGDGGTARRLKIIRFGERIPDAEIDTKLPHKLREEADAIFTWCVEGWRRYSSYGLTEPDSVTKDTREYIEDADDIQAFISDMCVRDRRAVTPMAELFALWDTWALLNHRQEISVNTFGRELQKKGFDAVKPNNVRSRAGIRLKEDE